MDAGNIVRQNQQADYQAAAKKTILVESEIGTGLSKHLLQCRSGMPHILGNLRILSAGVVIAVLQIRKVNVNDSVE
jgi:hypothetical protein